MKGLQQQKQQQHIPTSKSKDTPERGSWAQRLQRRGREATGAEEDTSKSSSSSTNHHQHKHHHQQKQAQQQHQQQQQGLRHVGSHFSPRDGVEPTPMRRRVFPLSPCSSNSSNSSSSSSSSKHELLEQQKS
ncbi:hypothetical protein ACSSS7_005216 [Eimeria intestinalis]